MTDKDVVLSSVLGDDDSMCLTRERVTAAARKIKSQRLENGSAPTMVALSSSALE
ncbi:hypothetical protein TWF506_000016 [Arthrobotrys conoides]|uniref:Uncharacterized protein n=1 Tax=Arthrobotrys conoides TaxID=74498 RepID=A0AAN8NXU3_9PEZI